MGAVVFNGDDDGVDRGGETVVLQRRGDREAKRKVKNLARKLFVVKPHLRTRRF